MDIWKSLDGMVEAELTSAEPGAALEAANARGIPLYDVIQVGDLTARFRVRRRDYRTLEALSEKRGETLRLRRRMGAYWTLKRLLARPMLLCRAGGVSGGGDLSFPPAFFSCGWRAT